MLVRQLPPESAFGRIQLGEYAGWTVDTYQAANIVDLLRILIWQQTKDGHAKTPKHYPKPSWRPGQSDTPEPAKRVTLTREEARAALDRIREEG